MKKIFILFFVMCIAAVPSFSEELEQEMETEEKPEYELTQELDRKIIHGEFWIGAAADMAMYTSGGANIGASISFGYGRGASIGVKATYLFDNEFNYDVFELMFLLRFYLFGRNYCSGLFIQFTGGQSLFFRHDDISLPSNWGVFNAGVNLGWRFHIGNVFFVEPIFRAGYPFFLGFSLSCGVRF